MGRWFKPVLVVVGVVIARWFAGNALWQAFGSVGGGGALAVLISPLTGLHGDRLYLFGVCLAMFLAGTLLYAVKFLPPPPLPPVERESRERERTYRENLSSSLVPLQAELEHNHEMLEIAESRRVYWNYDKGERLQSDQWNNRKNTLTHGGKARDWWLAMERAHREFDRLNREAIESRKNPVDINLPNESVLVVAFTRLVDAETELAALS